MICKGIVFNLLVIDLIQNCWRKIEWYQIFIYFHRNAFKYCYLTINFNLTSVICLYTVKCLNNSIRPIYRNLTHATNRTRVDQRVMTINENSTLLRYPELEAYR